MPLPILSSQAWQYLGKPLLGPHKTGGGRLMHQTSGGKKPLNNGFLHCPIAKIAWPFSSKITNPANSKPFRDANSIYLIYGHFYLEKRKGIRTKAGPLPEWNLPWPHQTSSSAASAASTTCRSSRFCLRSAWLISHQKHHRGLRFTPCSSGNSRGCWNTCHWPHRSRWHSCRCLWRIDHRRIGCRHTIAGCISRKAVRCRHWGSCRGCSWWPCRWWYRRKWWPRWLFHQPSWKSNLISTSKIGLKKCLIVSKPSWEFLLFVFNQCWEDGNVTQFKRQKIFNHPGPAFAGVVCGSVFVKEMVGFNILLHGSEIFSPMSMRISNLLSFREHWANH